MDNLSEKRVLFVIAPKNFRDEELLEPRKILEKNKAKTSIASSTLNDCIGMLGARITPNLSLDKVQVNDYDAVIFVGGNGSTIYHEDQLALNLAKEANIKGKLVGAICLGTGILAKANLLKGKKVTGFIDTKELVEKHGGTYTGNEVEVFERIITGEGPKASKRFGEEVVKALQHEFKD